MQIVELLQKILVLGEKEILLLHTVRPMLGIGSYQNPKRCQENLQGISCSSYINLRIQLSGTDLELIFHQNICFFRPKHTKICK